MWAGVRSRPVMLASIRPARRAGEECWRWRHGSRPSPSIITDMTAPSDRLRPEMPYRTAAEAHPSQRAGHGREAPEQITSFHRPVRVMSTSRRRVAWAIRDLRLTFAPGGVGRRRSGSVAIHAVQLQARRVGKPGNH